MQRCLEKLLLAPHLGCHIRTLHHLPDLLDIVYAAGLSPLDLSVWLLAVIRLCPRIAAVTTLPIEWISGCLQVASLPTVQDLRLDISPSQWTDCIDYTGSECRDFLRKASPGRLHVLALPPMVLKHEHNTDRIIIEVEHLFLSSCILDGSDASLSQWFDFRGLRFLTWRADDYDGLQLSCLEGLTSELVELNIEPHSRLIEAREPDEEIALDTQLCDLPTLRCLVHLRLRNVFLSMFDVEAIPNRCPVLEHIFLTACEWSEFSLEAWLTLIETLPHLRAMTFDACERAYFRSFLEEACAARRIDFRWRSTRIADDSSETESSESEATSTRSSSPWTAGDLMADESAGAPWYWVFNEIGRPVAIPHDPLDLASCPAASERDATDADAMSEDSCEWQIDETEYLPAVPDEPRFETNYQAVDPDNEDESCSTYEPWSAWSEPCDFAVADAAWIAYDVDEEVYEKTLRQEGDPEGDQTLREAVQDLIIGRSEAGWRPQLRESRRLRNELRSLVAPDRADRAHFSAGWPTLRPHSHFREGVDGGELVMSGARAIAWNDQ